jgi:hypothetical protein
VIAFFMFCDEANDPLPGFLSHHSPGAKPSDQLSIVDGEAPEGRFGDAGLAAKS